MDPLAPDAAERIALVRAALREGLVAGVDGHLAGAVEALAPARIAALAARPGAVLAVTARRAGTLKARAYDGDLARIELPADVTPDWIAAVADPSRDLMAPMKGPLRTRRDGDAGPARAALALARGARLLPAVLMAPGEAQPAVGAADIAQARRVALVRGPSARVPLAVSGAGRVHVFRAPLDGAEHVAVEVGAVDRARPALVRLHSACLTGDVLGSRKCDCGPQLHAALAAMGAASGVLLYLDQEGRGIGLANKMRAYALQDQGFDTVDANHRLGFEDDERDFRAAAQMLGALGIGSVRLMTNNPAKVARLEAEGIVVAQRVPLRVGVTDDNAAYLATKVARSGHLP